MQRAVLILFLFIALMNGRHPVLRKPQKPETMQIVATPLVPVAPIPAIPGGLRYLGGWSLVANHASFGGLSAMRMDADGTIIAQSDAGEVFTFRPGPDPSTTPFRAHMRLLPVLPEEKEAPRHYWDTESLAWDPASGRYWAGFEGRNRICRYAAGFSRVERCARPPAIREWPGKTGMESLARLPDRRFVAVAEDAPGPGGVGDDMLLFAGDPVDDATPPPLRIGYRRPQGYRPTDVLAIGGERLLILHRRLTLADGFTAVVTLVDLRHRRPGRLLEGRVVARIAAPVPQDNFEAMAIHWERCGDERGGSLRPILWIASDDNHLFFQRTLLLKYAMPPGWFDGAHGGGDGRVTPSHSPSPAPSFSGRP
ncbi:esterase-like activity of phytase family protein [Sphingobium sufflavum]|uniref:esterase-like activity of phytase family protein n=1 Tax=Sphingobium sufflavum TaxID=1129547 RepID=UPI001F2573B8|nr:esterase-like activity of phytase family protein [Sphingobium sufflavum]MCE7796111.1 esterase-like activity of phytase family protein [Sphingobium sufflavum]